MDVLSARYISSTVSFEDMPADQRPEFAFTGRSNVGKSSLINALCRQKDLAKTSSTPGKTQVVNHFLINDEWYLVDLPGYGYARVSKDQRVKFLSLITTFVAERDPLRMTFVLLDSRVKPQSIDMEFLEFLQNERLPFAVVLTKIDRLNQREQHQNTMAYQAALTAIGAADAPLLRTSANSGRGCKELLALIESRM